MSGFFQLYHNVLLMKISKLMHREISSVLCVHLEGWDREGGRETQEGGDMGMYIYL